MNTIKEISNIRKIASKFYKNKYWEKFGEANPFYISLENYNITILFTDTINEDTFGLYFIYNNEGYQFLNEQLKNKTNDIMKFYHFAGISLELVFKKDLKQEDIKLLHNQGQKASSINVFLAKNVPGKAIQGLSNKEIHVINECLRYLDSTLVKYKNKIISSFNLGQQPFVKAIEEKKELILAFDNISFPKINLPYLPINEDYFHKFKNASYINEGIYCYSNYLPVLFDRVRPMFLLIYYKDSRTLILNMSIDNYIECAYQTLERAVALNGLPVSVTFKNSKIYKSMRNTLSALNIDTIFNINNLFDKYFNLISESILNSINDDLIINNNNTEEFMKNLEDIFYNLIINEEYQYNDKLYRKLIQ